jgi:hypothetical protein
MSKAFVVEHCRADVTAAQQFGDVKYIFPRGYRRPGFWSSEYVDAAITSLLDQGFNPDEDSIVIVGHYNPLVVVIAKLISMYGHLKVLMWDSVSTQYQLKVIGEDYR